MIQDRGDRKYQAKPKDVAEYLRIPGSHLNEMIGRKIFSKKYFQKGLYMMKRIVTLSTRKLKDTAEHGGCGACQTSCQSACKTSCGIANQKCENTLNR